MVICKLLGKIYNKSHDGLDEFPCMTNRGRINKVCTKHKTIKDLLWKQTK